MAGMAGSGRTTPGLSSLGEGAQLGEDEGEAVDGHIELGWQSELDAALAEIDLRLSYPRRRATDIQPTPPNLGHPEITSEMIDEIAWRVSALLRGDGGEPPEATAVAAGISQSMPVVSAPVAPLPSAPLPEQPEPLAPGIALTLRLRWPFFRLPWRFLRRRRQAMISLSGYRVT